MTQTGKTRRGEYRDRRTGEKVVRRSEGRRERRRRRVRIMHYSWWLLGLREKGLYSISVFEASTLPPEQGREPKRRTRENPKEREKEKERQRDETGERSRGGVAFPEGRSREKVAGGCRNTRGGGGERGSNRVACNFEMDSTPPTTTTLPLSLRPPSTIHRVASLRSLPLRSFLRTRLVGWINPVPVGCCT